jgi:hypothetical protein
MAGEGKAAMQIDATSKPGDLPESNQQTSAENRKMHDRYSFRTLSFFFDPSIVLAQRRGKGGCGL